MCGCVRAGVCVRTFVSSHPRILLPFASPLTYAGGRKRNEQYEQGEFKKKKTGKNNNCKGMTWPKSHSRDMWHNIRSDRTAEVSPSSDLLRRVSNVTAHCLHSLLLLKEFWGETSRSTEQNWEFRAKSSRLWSTDFQQGSWDDSRRERIVFPRNGAGLSGSPRAKEWNGPLTLQHIQILPQNGQ